MGLTIYTGPVDSRKAESALDKAYGLCKRSEKNGDRPSVLLCKPAIDIRFGNYVRVNANDHEVNFKLEDSHDLLKILAEQAYNADGGARGLNEAEYENPEDFEQTYSSFIDQRKIKRVPVLIEAHLLDERIIEVSKLLSNKLELVISCLDKDHLRRPFKFRNFKKQEEDSNLTVDDLIKVTEEIGGIVNPLYGICTVCKREAQYSQRISLDGNPIISDERTVAIPHAKKGETPKFKYEARCEEHHIMS